MSICQSSRLRSLEGDDTAPAGPSGSLLRPPPTESLCFGHPHTAPYPGRKGQKAPTLIHARCKHTRGGGASGPPNFRKKEKSLKGQGCEHAR